MADSSHERDEIIRRRLFGVTGVTPPERPRAVSAGGWLPALRDRLPVPVQAVAGLGWAHLAALALVVSVALLVGAWWMARSASSGEVVPMAAPAPVTSTSASVGGSVVGTVEVVVDVAGRVRHPGVYHLAEGSRVIDAIEAAGGALRGVDLSQVNQARVLVDGEQILLVRRPGSSAGSTTAGTGARVNINTADQALLETLPGIGPVTAESILRWRSENGPFSSVDALLDVSGIGEATLERLRPYVTV